MKLKNLNIFALFVVMLFFNEKETQAFDERQIDLEIQNEYQKFKGYTIPGTSHQPCLAIQFVYSLQEKLKQTQDDNIAQKIVLIVGRGVGVGGISERQATEEESKLLYSALYQVASFKINEECYSFDNMYCTSFGPYAIKSGVYKTEVNQLINISISKIVTEDKLQLNSSNFLKDNKSYEILVESVIYKICGMATRSAQYVQKICNNLGFNEKTSFDQCMALAKKGRLKAQYLVGNLYGFKDNKEKCFSWCKISAENGYIPAQRALAVFYQAGYGVERDFKMHLKWLTSAAEQGDLDSQYELAEEYYNNPWAERDDVQFSLAAKWYRCCAERGLSKAQQRLVNMYQQGLGVPKNEIEAAKWQDIYDENDSDEYEYGYKICTNKSIF